MRRWIAALLAAVLVAACGGADGGDTVPAKEAPRAEEISFTTEDGVELHGYQIGEASDTAVVLAHMRGSNKDAWVDVAVGLSRNDVTAFAFDFRGYEGQEGRRDTRLVDDLLAAVVEMRARGAAKIFVAGASMGGSAALALAAEHRLDGVVAVSAPATFGDVDAGAAAPNVEEPALFIVARDDQPYAADAERLAQASGGRVQNFDGAAHGTDLLQDHHDEFIAAIIRFVKDPTG